MNQDNKLIFCEYIDSQNNPINIRKTFELGPAGVNVKFLAPVPNQVSNKILYEIHKVNQDSSEEYEDAIFTSVNPQRDFHSCDFTFYKSGRFKVRIYDSKKKNLLNSGVIQIKNPSF